MAAILFGGKRGYDLIGLFKTGVCACEKSFEIGRKTFNAIPMHIVWEVDRCALFLRVIKTDLGGLTCYFCWLDKKLNISEYSGKCQKQAMSRDYVLKAEALRLELIKVAETIFT